MHRMFVAAITGPRNRAYSHLERRDKKIAIFVNEGLRGNTQQASRLLPIAVVSI